MKFELPVIHDPRQLANRLGLTPEDLCWLANQTSDRLRPEETAKHYTSRWMRKRGGGWRLIEAPKSKLRFTQKILLELIFNKVPPHPLSFGFCKGRSVIDFLKPHRNRDVCWKLDLSEFFLSISTGRVFGLLRKLGYRHDVAHVIALLTTVETNPRTLGLDHPTASLSIRSPRHQIRHLPQGAPTSPAIANLCAFGLDVRLSGLARKIGGVHYTRYADDILFSGDCDFARQAKRLHPLVGAIAIEEGFEINYRKTRLMRSGQCQFAAGVVINEKLNVRRKEYDRLKATLHNCIKHGPDSQNLSGHPAFREHLDGRVQWIQQLNSQKGKKLRNLFDQVSWN